VRWLIAMDIWMEEKAGRRPRWPILSDPSETMPTQEPHRGSEAVRRILPDLIKLDRYESRTVEVNLRRVSTWVCRERRRTQLPVKCVVISCRNEPNSISAKGGWTKSKAICSFLPERTQF
jgi:hypothetical protein